MKRCFNCKHSFTFSKRCKKCSQYSKWQVRKGYSENIKSKKYTDEIKVLKDDLKSLTDEVKELEKELAECNEAGRLTMAAYLRIKENALLGEAINLAVKENELLVKKDDGIYVSTKYMEIPIMRWFLNKKEGQ